MKKTQSIITTSPGARCLPLLCLMSVLCSSPVHAGPGLLERNRKNYYRPPINTMYRKRLKVSCVDISLFRRPWSEDVRMNLERAGFLKDWSGERFGAPSPCSRYEAAFLIGKMSEYAYLKLGAVFACRLEGPKVIGLPSIDWGRRSVRRAVRSGLFTVRGRGKWWRRPISKGTFIGQLEHIIDLLSSKIPVLELPLRFPPRGSGMGVPLRGDPRYRRIRKVYRRGLIDISTTDWSVRQPLSTREAVLAMDRLIFIIDGYEKVSSL